MMDETSKVVTSGHELWSDIESQAGLNLGSYDTEFGEMIRKTLRLNGKDPIGDLIRARQIGVEELLSAVFCSSSTILVDV